MKLKAQFEFKDLSQKSFVFDTIESLKGFLETELSFWNEKNAEVQKIQPVSSTYLSCFNPIQAAFNFVESWTQQLPNWDDSAVNQKLIELKNNYLPQVSNCWIWSGHAFIKPWVNCYKYSQQTGDSFLDIILNKNFNGIQNYDTLRGYLFAYEFLQQDESLITKRRLSEAQSFGDIKDQLIKKKTELIDDVTVFKDSLTGWKEDTKKNVAGWQSDQRQHFEEASLYRSNNFESRLSSWTQAVTDLEIKYKEKLRFDGPAKYWKDSADRLKEQGNNYIIALVVISSVFILCLGKFFHSWLQGHPSNLNLQSLEGVVLFASVLSGFAILIRTFSRLAFSSFHLQRDAEEREQLTHLYLSLANETNVDDESRKIVLQALFSRSETGLLANDSSPTMPGVTDIASLIGKK